MNGTRTNHTASLPNSTTPADIMHAAEKVRDAGFRSWDVFTPFPVHGMDRAMGLKNSKVGWFSFLGGVTGYTRGMLMIWWMNAVDYPIVIGGKPMFSPFAAFPPSYELTILFGAFGSLVGMLFLNRLPRLHHPLLKNRRFALVTHDRYFLVIETSDPKYSSNRNPQAARRRSAASTSRWWRNNALLPFNLCGVRRGGDRHRRHARHAFRASRRLYIFPDMKRQLKLRPQTPNDFFENGGSSQLPPCRAPIARGKPIQWSPASRFIPTKIRRSTRAA